VVEIRHDPERSDDHKKHDQDAEGQFQHVSGGGTVFTADINGLSPSATSSQVAVTAGLRTRF